jgi:hypothetical protein
MRVGNGKNIKSVIRNMHVNVVELRTKMDRLPGKILVEGSQTQNKKPDQPIA